MLENSILNPSSSENESEYQLEFSEEDYDSSDYDSDDESGAKII